MYKVTVFVTIILFQWVNCDIFNAQVELEALFDLRKSIFDATKLYLQKEEIRLQEVREQLLLSSGLSKVDCNSNSNAKDNGKLNPLNAFLLIKGLSVDLANVLIPALDKSNIKELSGIMDDLNENKKFPNNEDLKGAVVALTRLQDTYHLKTKALSEGCVQENFCSTQLSVDDCFEIGKQSYQARNYDHSILWLNEALTKLEKEEQLLTSDKNNSTVQLNRMRINEESITRSHNKPMRIHKTTKAEILDYLSWAEDIKNTLNIGKKFLAELTGIELDAFIDEVVKAAESQPSEEPLETTYSDVLKMYEGLCRGEHRGVTSINPELKCSYSTRNKNPYFIIGPVQEERISLDPPIWIFHKVLYDKEIQVIKELATPMFKTATVVNSATGGTEHSNSRVSKSSWLIDSDDELIEKVNKRIGYLVGLDMETAEDLQVANYGLGGMYLPHFDFAHTNETVGFLAQDEGNRIATLMFYMSDVEAGGATTFPHIKLSIWPEKGSAAFWFNLKPDGRGDFKTQHAACPVLVGSKWVANKWIHERGQEFIRPCDLFQNVPSSSKIY